MTDVTTYQPTTDIGTTGANLIREAAAVMVDAHALATAVADTQMIPKHFQGKPDECAAAMLYGASLGLDPMQSVRQIYVVHGQAALYARAMSALVQGAGHKVWTVESTDQSVTVSGSRRGSEHVETATWTFDRAQKAGYTNNAKYKTDPQAMLYSKALSEVCRKIAPDTLSGVYSVEEMQMEGRADTPAAPTVSVASLAKKAEPASAAPQADPLKEAKSRLWQAWLAAGNAHSGDALTAEYEQWAAAPIDDATVEQLDAFAATLTTGEVIDEAELPIDAEEG